MTETNAAVETEGDFRAGFVAVVGLPNVGKSTLVNALVGAPLAIVTPKAQTTRSRLQAIHTDDRHQAVFVDTPGLVEPRYALHAAMREDAEAAARDADVLLFVADAGYEPSLEAARTFSRPAAVPAILCLNKTDRVDRETADRVVGELRAGGWEEVHRTVATSGRGVAALRAAILERLPVSPPLFPPEDLAVEPLRHFVAEFVREACFGELGKEVPYAVAVRIDEFREREGDGPVYIAATLFVERPSQKGIVIGAGGRKIREIGAAARRRIEEFLGARVYLDLRVKVLRNWRRRRNALRMLGFRPPPEEG